MTGVSSDFPGPPSEGFPNDDERAVPLQPDEREDIVADLEDLEVYRALLESAGIRGIVVDCIDCDTQHYIGWDLMQANLRQLLDEGMTGLHEPPFDPDPAQYVTWEYARGFADGVASENAED